MNAVVKDRTTARVGSPLIDEVLSGLRRTPKEISPVWLYDELGSRLFDAICQLPEYYPTRAELKIMELHAGEMAWRLGQGVALIEFGSGSSLKTRLLLDHLESPDVYVPVDISRAQLLDTAGSIARDYPWLRVLPACADFTRPLRLDDRAAMAERRVVYFPGSTIGNFDALAARKLLTSMRELIGRQGAILIGIDLKKDVATLERAYNDSSGITARFNLNVLRHLNRELNADFQSQEFAHSAVWVENLSRIEMRLVSRRDQRVHIDGHAVDIKRDEYIRTECSHKYTLGSLAELAESAGLRVHRVWCDPERTFSVQLLEPR